MGFTDTSAGIMDNAEPFVIGLEVIPSNVFSSWAARPPLPRVECVLWRRGTFSGRNITNKEHT